MEKVAEFHERGYCSLEGALDVELIDKLREETLRNFDDCLSIIEQRELEFGVGIKHGFKEIVQRHEARFEMTYRMDELDRSFIEGKDSATRRLVEGILGEDCQIVNMSAVVSLPGAKAQAWHSDGPHMSSIEHLPAHVLNVFIPLIPMTRAHGATEFRPKSHVMTRDLTTLFLAAAVKKRLEPLDAPLVGPGSAVLFDYRVLHRGLANTSGERRPILVYTFAKPWYSDVLNFPKYSIDDEKIDRDDGDDGSGDDNVGDKDDGDGCV